MRRFNIIIALALSFLIPSQSLLIQMTTNQPNQTFYRRPLPDSCVALSSKRGRDIFAAAHASKGLKSFFPLIEQYTTQSEPAYCGISTLVIALNAFAIDPRQVWKGPWRWYDERMLNCCVDLEEAKQVGVDLEKFACLALCQGLHVQVHYADTTTESIENFRQAIQTACVEDDDGEDTERLHHVLIASYTRQALGQTGTGHFSPIAAFDASSDSVLILDTARFKYGAHWVPLSLLYKAMQPVDTETGKSRGYVLLSYYPDDEKDNDLLYFPKSILFQSEMRQSSVRREFQTFLDTQSSYGWEDIVEYWTRNGPQSIWTMIQPQFKQPLEHDTMDLVHEVLQLIDRLLPTVMLERFCGSCCRKNHSRSLDIHPRQAVFVVYLASLSEDERHQIVFSDTESSLIAKNQLVAEAELIDFALKASKDMEGLLEAKS